MQPTARPAAPPPTGRVRLTPAGTALAMACTVGALMLVATLGVAQGPERPVAVRVWEGQEIIPTYELGPEDPNPHFFELEGTIIYPYTMQDRFTTRKVDRTYRTLYLENEYLRVMCLPQLGGRIQSVLDKVTGQEVFYRNHVIRPGHIALRGAWISGGIEWNRGPRGHTVTSFSAVDVVAVQNPDGSASLLIGGTEKIFRTGWQVTLTLRPGRRVLEERIRLFNPTDGFHPYYFWNNTAFPDTPGARFIFPMRLGTDHAGERFFSWPLFEDRDLRWVRNYPEPTSIFGYRVEFDFFGAYDVDRDFGVVQFANHHQLPGKKAWTWGQSDAGKVAQSVLTDEDGPYIEVQSGPLRTQADFAMLAPGQEISWQEWWYPVNGLGLGFEYATRDLAVQRVDLSGRIELRIASNGSFPGARVQIERIDGRVVHRQVDLSPVRTDVVSIDVSGLGIDAERVRLLISVRSAEGDDLLSYESPLLIPAPEPPEPDPGHRDPTAETEFQRGYELDRQSNRVGAARHYRAVLEIDPGHSRSLRALAVLDMESGLHEPARERLRLALQRDDSDGMTWYLLAVTNLWLGDLETAIAAGDEAVERPGTVGLGYSAIGRARARLGDYRGATEAFAAGLAAGGADWTRLFELAMLATYGVGQQDVAAQLGRQSTRAGTLRLLPSAIQALGTGDSLREFVLGARRWLGEPEFAFLELSLAFADVGLVRDAYNVLEAAVSSLAPAQRRPLPLYYLAYFADRLRDEQEARRWLAEAASRPAAAVFPSRPETLAVLQYALRVRANDGRAHLYLGNLYAGLGRLAEAVAQWRLAIRHGPDLAVARRNLAFYEWKVTADLDAAAGWLEQAIAIDPADQTLYRDLAQVLRQGQRTAEAVRLLENVPAGPDRRADVTLLLARSYVDRGRFDDAIELLGSTTFSNREGDTGSWHVFSQAHVARGVERLDAGDAAAALVDFEAALTYPANLNAGRPYRPREARAQYWRGRALATLGRPAEATRAWRTCAAGARIGVQQIDFVQRCQQQLEDSSPG